MWREEENDKPKDYSFEDRAFPAIEILSHKCGTHTHNPHADGRGRTSVATAQTYTDLFNFDGTHGGCLHGISCGILAQGRDGNLYGTTQVGGTNGYGVVFRITPSGKLKVLYNFDGVHGVLLVWWIDARDRRELLRYDRARRRQRSRDDLQDYEERKPDHSLQLHGRHGRLLSPRTANPGCRREFLRHNRAGRELPTRSRRRESSPSLGSLPGQLLRPTAPGNRWELLRHDFRWRQP